MDYTRNYIYQLGLAIFSFNILIFTLSIKGIYTETFFKSISVINMTIYLINIIPICYHKEKDSTHLKGFWAFLLVGGISNIVLSIINIKTIQINPMNEVIYWISTGFGMWCIVILLIYLNTPNNIQE
jgi:hypothetical protein